MSDIPAWVRMWLLAWAIFFVSKALTWARADPRLRRSATLGRKLGYLLGWVGMNPDRFLDPARRPPRPTAREWRSAAARTAIGLALLFGLARLVPSASAGSTTTGPAARLAASLLCGWIGMAGLICVLHFGSFQLLSLVWRRAGADAGPMMERPALSHSLGEFWGRRWNLPFHDLAERVLLKPLKPRVGAPLAAFAVFLFSGLAHEAVISVPAGAGYGLPTAYFLFQYAGIALGRSRLGRRLRLRRGNPGHLFTLLWVALPAFLLFHPPFVERVILPFLHAIGALG